MKNFISIILFCCCLLPFGGDAFAQGKETFSTTDKVAIARLRDGLNALEAGKTANALERIKSAIQQDPQFIEAYMYLGYVYQKIEKHEFAVENYQKALDIDAKQYLSTHLKMAESQIALGKFTEVIENVEAFLKIPDLPPKAKTKAEKILKQAKFSEKAFENPVPFEPFNLGIGVNTTNDEYLPAITADGQTLIITRREVIGNGYGRRTEDFYVSDLSGDEWGKATNLGPPINTNGNEGAQCISPDGRKLFFTACNRKGGKGGCDIFMATRMGNRWSTPRNLGAPVNTAHWESQPSISADGRTLYFTSSRPGGKGQSDIWKSVLQSDGSWSNPESMSFNTKGEDVSPYMHPDNATLYFASNGHPGMGALDIYYVRKQEDGLFGEPINLGYPINTSKEDACLIVSASGDRAYFSSNRNDSEGGLDIYSFDLYAEARPARVEYIKGKVTDKATGKPLSAWFRLRNLESGVVVAASSSDPLTGDFLVTLPAGKDYALTVTQKGYLFHSENFSLKEKEVDPESRRLDVALQPIGKDVAIELRNVFFATGSYNLDPKSKVELDRLAIFLKQNASLKVTIEGHTDNVGLDATNQALSENRAKAVVDFLEKKEISRLRVEAIGFGSQKPKESNATVEGRAGNRRIEIRIREM